MRRFSSYDVMSGFGLASSSAAVLSRTRTRSFSSTLRYTFHGTCAALSER